MKQRFNPMHKRKQITIYSVSDENNQVLYCCVANNLTWAKELFTEQFESKTIPTDRTFHWHVAELSGANFKQVLDLESKL